MHERALDQAIDLADHASIPTSWSVHHKKQQHSKKTTKVEARFALRTAPMTTGDVGRPRNGKRPLVSCAATHAQLHDSRLDRTLCHARCTDFRSITCDVAYGSRLGRQEHEQVDVEVSAPKGARRLRVRIVTQLRSRLGLTRALRVELTVPSVTM